MTKLRTFVGGLLGPFRRLPVLVLRPPKNRLQRYVAAAFAGLAAIALATVVILHMTPSTYTSRWTLILPGSGSDANLILQGIGQASSNSASPYASISRSPRINYREIVMSDTVLSLAADIAEIPRSEFGKPRVKLVQQSSLMNFTIVGESPQTAERKASAVNAALRQTLDRLRGDELALREAGMRSAIEDYAVKMRDVRGALLQHQEATQLVSANQVDELIASVESVQRELIDVSSDTEQKASYLATLGKALNVSDRLAAAAVILHADETIRTLTQQYVDARALLEGKRGIFGNNHPRIVSARATLAAAEEDYRQRAFELLGTRDIDISRLVLLDVEDATGAMFRDLVSTAAQLEGLRARQASLSQQLDLLRNELQTKLVAVAQLSDLERDHKIAEAVFSSALARIDTGKSDLFVSYPLIQTIVPPSQPISADRRPTLFAVAGGALASMFYLIGLLLLWFRTPLCD
ncbi:MAG: hypothetical protein AAF351_03860 [Pseudomonadota bacterium]